MSNDIKEYMLLQYTDDTQFLHNNTINNIDLIQKTQETLHRATMYFLKNRLLMNDKKTVYIHSYISVTVYCTPQY